MKLLGATLLTVLLLVGCASQTNPAKTSGEIPPNQGTTGTRCAVDAPAQTKGTTKVLVHFTCDGETRPLVRHVPETKDILRAALDELLKGPSPEEQANGFTSYFSSKTTGMVKGVTVSEDGKAVVNFFNFSTLINNASTTAGGAQLMRELNKTVFQASEVKNVMYQFDGSCDAFGHWLQSGCQVFSASNYR